MSSVVWHILSTWQIATRTGESPLLHLLMLVVFVLKPDQSTSVRMEFFPYFWHVFCWEACFFFLDPQRKKTGRGSWKAAQEVLGSLTWRSIQVDLVTSNAAVSAMDKGKQWEARRRCGDAVGVETWG